MTVEPDEGSVTENTAEQIAELLLQQKLALILKVNQTIEQVIDCEHKVLSTIDLAYTAFTQVKEAVDGLGRERAVAAAKTALALAIMTYEQAQVIVKDHDEVRRCTAAVLQCMRSAIAVTRGYAERVYNFIDEPFPQGAAIMSESDTIAAFVRSPDFYQCLIEACVASRSRNICLVVLRPGQTESGIRVLREEDLWHYRSDAGVLYLKAPCLYELYPGELHHPGDDPWLLSSAVQSGYLQFIDLHLKSLQDAFWNYYLSQLETAGV